MASILSTLRVVIEIIYKLNENDFNTKSMSSLTKSKKSVEGYVIWNAPPKLQSSLLPDGIAIRTTCLSKISVRLFSYQS